MNTTQEEIAELKAQLESLSTRLSVQDSIDECTPKEIKEYLQDLNATLKEKWDQKSTKIKDGADHMQKYAEEHPWQVAGAAALLAAAITILGSNKKK